MLLQGIGYNKNLIPPPLHNDNYTYIDLITKIIETIFIDEDENFMRLKKQMTRFWFNSYLTFQNLKKDSVNEIGMSDRENMWKPFFDTVNTENEDKCTRTDNTEIFTATPENNFVLNEKHEIGNAFLYKVKYFLPEHKMK